MVIPQSIFGLVTIVTFSRANVGRILFFRGMALLGLVTFVNKQEGPQKTLSSRVSPS